MTSIIRSIRELDQYTPIILEPTFYGQVAALSKFPIEEFLKVDSNLVISIHFYEPMTLTSRTRNKGRYSFPSSIPWYEHVEFGEETYWDEDTIFEQLQKAKMWACDKGVRLFVGEFGICRDVEGAPDYLKAVINSCKKLNITGLIFSYRDPCWEAMDYEFGQQADNFVKNKVGADEQNSLMKVLLGGFGNNN